MTDSIMTGIFDDRFIDAELIFLDLYLVVIPYFELLKFFMSGEEPNILPFSGLSELKENIGERKCIAGIPFFCRFCCYC